MFDFCLCIYVSCYFLPTLYFFLFAAVSFGEVEYRQVILNVNMDFYVRPSVRGLV
jgi:hypothetical protein